MIERFFPDMYVKKVEDINFDNLKNKGIKGMILDIDNTLIDYYKNIRESTIEWIDTAKKNDIKVYLVSNNSKERVNEIANKLSLKYVFHAAKPLKKGLVQAMNEMDINNTEVAVVGDQIFTDVYGGNRLNMLTILVEQISIKDIFVTKLKRPLEKYVLNRYNERSTEQDTKKASWKQKSANAKGVCKK
ncbi:MAG: YqeG family HAD IIIA-type phosphatase [Clostridia bacterium]|nr:YqeG family HAD IIIA-type phosphatase [Clostridia bacterium]